MNIKVVVKHWIYKSPPAGLKPAIIEYDYIQEFFFTWENNIIKTNNWSKPVDTLEQCFKAIKGYFYGTHYDIIDFVKMND